MVALTPEHYNRIARLLDPVNTSVTLETLARASRALGKPLSVRIGATPAPAQPRTVRPKRAGTPVSSTLSRAKAARAKAAR